MGDLWKCPKCGTVLQKSSPRLADVVHQGGMVSGTATCGKCLAAFSQYDIYDGKFDIDTVWIGKAPGAAAGNRKWWHLYK